MFHRIVFTQVRVLTAFGSASSKVELVNISGLGHSPEGSPSIQDHHRRGGEMLPCSAVDHRFPKTGHPNQSKAHGTTLRSVSDGRHERGLSGSAPSPLSAVSLPTPVGLINPDEAAKRRLSSRSFIT